MKNSTGSAVLLMTTALALGSANVNAIEQWQNGFDIRAGYMSATNETTIELSGERVKGEINLATTRPRLILTLPPTVGTLLKLKQGQGSRQK